MDLKKIEQGVQLILEGAGVDVQRDGLEETPQRVAKMYEEIFAGLEREPQIHAEFNEDVGENDSITIRDIGFYSMCEHHLLPFFGSMDVLYVPRDGRVAGFSTITRVVDLLSRRPQLQERLTRMVAETLYEQLNAKGVAVIAHAQQLCVSMRGERKQDVRTVTEAVRGDLSPDVLTAFRR